MRRSTPARPPEAPADHSLVLTRFDIQQWLLENARNSEASTSGIVVDLQLDADQERKAREQARLAEEQRFVWIPFGFRVGPAPLRAAPLTMVLRCTLTEQVTERSSGLAPLLHRLGPADRTWSCACRADRGVARGGSARGRGQGRTASRRRASHAVCVICRLQASQGCRPLLTTVCLTPYIAALEDYYRQRQSGSLPTPSVALVKKEEAADDDAQGLRPASGVSSVKRSRSSSVSLDDAGESKRWKGEEGAAAAIDSEVTADEEEGAGAGDQVFTGRSLPASLLIDKYATDRASIDHGRSRRG